MKIPRQTFPPGAIGDTMARIFRERLESALVLAYKASDLPPVVRKAYGADPDRVYVVSFATESEMAKRESAFDSMGVPYILLNPERYESEEAATEAYADAVEFCRIRRERKES